MTCTGKRPLPAWEQLSELDKGAVLLHLDRRNREGADYATDNYPARYFDNPVLTALSPLEACRHAVSVRAGAQALGVAEYGRLYDLALDADNARWAAEHPQDGA